MAGVGKFYVARRVFDEDDEFWPDPILWRAWLDLVQMAAFTDTETKIRGQRIAVKRGQLFKSIRTLAKRWGTSIGKTHRFLTRCVEIGRIEKQDIAISMEHRVEHQAEHPVEHLGTLITICNYDTWQGATASGGTRRGTASGTASGTKRIKNKEGNKNYIVRCAEMWEQAMGGAIPHGRIGKAFKPLVAKHGEDEVCEFWGRYLKSTKEDARYKTPEQFAQKFGIWKAQQSTVVGPTVDDVLRAIALGGSDLWYLEAREDGLNRIAEKDAALFLRVGAVLRSLDWKYLHTVQRDKFALERAIKAALGVSDAA